MQERRIMIVEDEAVVRLHLSRIVAAMGHRVTGLAASADEALAAAETEAPELVLMDINLAGRRDGVETARELVGRHGCGVVFATAFADEATLARTQDSGAVGYIVKPFGESAVRAAVTTALGEFDRLQAVRSKERSLAGILGSLGEAVVLVDASFRVMFLNPRAERLAWCEGRRVQGLHVLEALHASDDDSALVQAVLAEVGAQGETVLLPTVALQLPDGSDILVNGSVAPLSDGRGTGFVISLHDLSRQWNVTTNRCADGGRRLMIYSHDTFGLGHLRRSLNLAAALARAVPDLSVMLVTGSAVAHRFPLPDRVDYVKLPAVRKVAAERYAPRSLALPDDEVLAMRANLLLRTARDFRPDMLLVDHSPAGMRGELRPALEWLRTSKSGCTTVLGLRDIIDAPETVRETWHRQGIHRLLQDGYDHVVIYGEQHFFDPVSAYGLAPDLAERVTFVGHVVEDAVCDRARSLTGTPPHIVVTTGGGDGAVDEVAGRFLRMLGRGLLGRDANATVLPGPLGPAATPAVLRMVAAGTPAVIEPFVESTSPLMAAADLVICTGGYNTAMQAMRYARRVLMMPRVAVSAAGIVYS